jgi:RNA polymerase sigma-70 factor (ECF subfamily)
MIARSAVALQAPRIRSWRSTRFRPLAVQSEWSEAALIDALRRGDQAAFTVLLECHHRPLLRLAQLYVRDAATAEEVVQDTWIGVLEGIDRFEGRSSLSTWIYRILTNRAKSRGQRDQRQVPLSVFAVGPDEPEVEEERFRPIDDPRHPQQWAQPPRAWPHERLLAHEMVEQLRLAVAQLPPAQQVVVGLRDIEGWSAEQVCEALEITPGNQRVLLHRARARLRGALESYLEGS